MISKLELENFAAFKNLKLDFSPKINIIIGENSCGKTQLLKAAYALNFTQSKIAKGDISTKPQVNDELTSKLLGLFKPEEQKIGGLYHRMAESKTSAKLSINNGAGEKFGCEISSIRAGKVTVSGNHKLAADEGVFIPTKEVLSLLSAIANMQVDNKHLMALFDDTVFDLCHRLLAEPQNDLKNKLNVDPRLGMILPNLSGAIGGLYEIDGSEQRFIQGEYIEEARVSSKSKHASIYSDGTLLRFEPEKGGAISTTMTAEGFRKVGVLQRLLENGGLSLADDSPLFWDEPESNMNPKLMRMLVDTLLEMSRSGKQIILASHDYVLLKWFDLLRDEGKGDHILYHSLYKGESGVIEVNTTSDYLDIYPNAIDDTFEFLINSELDRSIGDIGQ